MTVVSVHGYCTRNLYQTTSRSDEAQNNTINKLSGITSMKASANSCIYGPIKIWRNYFNDENDIIM